MRRGAYELLLRHGRCHNSLARRPGVLISMVQMVVKAILPQRNAETLGVGLHKRQIPGS